MLKIALTLLFLCWFSYLQGETGKIAEGTPWETEYHIIDTCKPGPTILIVGGMHGNEPAGAVAASQILTWPIKKGKLIVLPRANVLALNSNTRLIPGEPEEAGNLNRNFPQQQQGSDEWEVQPIGKLALALWGFIARQKPDWILDLHEGHDFNRSHKPPKGKKKSVGSSIIYDNTPELDCLARRMIAAADETVTDPDKKFMLIPRGPVNTGLARACINRFGANGLILETTFKNQPLSLRTLQHRSMVSVFLQHVGLIVEDCRDVVAVSNLPQSLR